MASFLLLLLNVVPVIFGRDDFGILFSSDYFTYRDVKSLCYISCEENYRILPVVKLAKYAFQNSIAMSNTVAIAIDNHEDINKCLRHQMLPVGVLMDTNCPSYNDILYQASRATLFGATHKWLLIAGVNESRVEENHSTKIIASGIVETFSRLNLSVDTDVVVALRNDDSTYEMLEFYNFGKIQGSELVVQRVGTWNNNSGLNLSVNLNEYIYYRRWNFRELQMRMILVVFPIPENFTTKMLTDPHPVPGFALMSKISLMNLIVISEIHNIKFVYTITNAWVTTFERNSSRVVANSLYFKEQDITPILRDMKYYNDKVQFLHTPLTSIQFRYYYRIPMYGVGKFENQFLRPLTFGAWGCVVGIIGLCSVVLLLSSILEHRPSTIQYAVFSAIASVCQQFFEDVDDNRTRIASSARKLTILVTGLACVLIYNYYTSSVVSWLLNAPPATINSLRELIDSPLEVIFEDIGYTWSWLQNPTYYFNKKNAIVEDELRQKKVFNKKKGSTLVTTLAEGIALVKSGGYALHTQEDNAVNLISKTFDQMELCELGSLDSSEKTKLFPCVQKNSPYRQFFVWSLMRLSERGIVSCIQGRTKSMEISCEGSTPRALALGGAAPAFIMLLAGYIVATVIMMAERLIYNLRRSQIKQFQRRQQFVQ